MPIHIAHVSYARAIRHPNSYSRYTEDDYLDNPAFRMEQAEKLRNNEPLPGVEKQQTRKYCAYELSLLEARELQRQAMEKADRCSQFVIVRCAAKLWCHLFTKDTLELKRRFKWQAAMITTGFVTGYWNPLILVFLYATFKNQGEKRCQQQ